MKLQHLNADGLDRQQVVVNHFEQGDAGGQVLGPALHIRCLHALSTYESIWHGHNASGKSPR